MHDQSLHIGFVTCHFPPDSIGGGQVQSYRLCDALGRHHAVAVYSRDYSGSGKPTERIGNFQIVRRRTVNIPLIRSIVDLMRGLADIRRSSLRTDLYIAFHAQLAALMIVIARKLWGIVAVISPRGEEDFVFSGIRRPFQKMLYENCSGILIQSEVIREEFSRRIRTVFPAVRADRIIAKIRIFPNGIARREERTAPPLQPIPIVFVGRLVAIKGIHFLLDAIRSTPGRYRLVIVGDGPLRSELERDAAGLPVEFKGLLGFQEVEHEIQSASALVLPSLSENLPNVVLEALAAGVPVIATSVGALPELIENGKNGFLVRPGNSGDIAEALDRMFVSEEHYRAMSASALSSAYRFTWDALLPQLITTLKGFVRHG